VSEYRLSLKYGCPLRCEVPKRFLVDGAEVESDRHDDVVGMEAAKRPVLDPPEVGVDRFASG
jgi:hypothetical protein